MYKNKHILVIGSCIHIFKLPCLKTIVFQKVLVLASAADAILGRSPLPPLGWLSCCSAFSKVKASFQLWTLGYEETRYGGYGLELLRSSSEQMSS